MSWLWALAAIVAQLLVCGILHGRETRHRHAQAARIRQRILSMCPPETCQQAPRLRDGDA